ncbi:MAG: sigma-70 family RNA polymerase sigma factor [Clostridia bacterium]|nr:sigma-70 family RNA polymerase sigma factor [Clostridia bacterium]
MNHLEFSFGEAVWEQAIAGIAPGGEMDGVQFLAMMEPESEENMEAALSMLDEKDILLTVDALGDFAASADSAVRLRLEKELVKQGNLPQGLTENDPLRLYLEEIAALPACGDAQILAEQYAQGDEAVLPQLTNLMLSRVAEAAFALAGRGVLLLDLLQEGGLGLWQGILSFQGGEFEAHCDRYVKRSLHRALILQAREFGVGQKMRQAMEDYRSTDEQLLADLGRNPTLEELAEALHMTVEETTVVAEMLETARRMHLAKQEPEPEEEELAQTQAVEDTAYFQMRQRIADLLSNLDETDTQLLTLRFGLEKGLPMSAEEVGKIMGMTADEVTAREAQALSKLRNEE